MCRVLGLMVLAVSSVVAAAEEGPDSTLLDDLIAAQGRAMARIETSHIVYDFDMKLDAPPASHLRSCRMSGTVEQWTRGGEARIRYNVSQVDTSDKPVPPMAQVTFDARYEFVCNAAYRANWSDVSEADLNPLKVAIHEHIDRPDDETQVLDNMLHLWDPLKSAFRTNHYGPARPLRAMGEGLQKPYKIGVQRGAESNTFVCGLYSYSVPDLPVRTVTIDSSRGNMTTSVHVDNSIFEADASLHQEYSWNLTPQEAAPGIWLPSRIEYHGKSSSNETRTTITVNVCEVNVPVDEALFHWQGLGYPGKELFVRFPDGSGKRIKLDKFAPDYIPEKPYVPPVGLTGDVVN